MKTMFRLCWGSIDEVEVIKTSDKSVWYMARSFTGENVESRDLLKTNSHEWFTTKQEAINKLMRDLRSKVASAKDRLAASESSLKAAEKEYK